MKEKFNAKVLITHVALQVEDLQASVEFYKKWCGMEAVEVNHPGVGEETSVWLACPGQEANFVIVLLPDGHGEFKKEGMRHIGFALSNKEDLKKLAKEAEAEGVLHWPYQEHKYPVGILFSIKDPDGHIIEFSYGQPLGKFNEPSNDNSGHEDGAKKLEHK